MYRFFEVFKTLKLPEDLAVYFENVEVTKVSKTSTNSLARVYIKSDRVIEKPIIFKVEDALKKQIFRISNMDVRIIDRYILSAQYTPQTVMDIYYDSILAELEKYWTLEYNLLKNSQWEFEKEDMLVFTIEDSFLAHQYADTLTDYFKKIFLNRFGFEIDVEYQYAKKKESQYERENAYKINLRVKEIENNIKAAAEDNADGRDDKKLTSEQKAAKKAETAAKQKAARAAFFASDNRGREELKTYSRKPANEDVLYGRDFDGDVTPIEQIDTAIGDVIISGMVRNVEMREIRNERTIIMFNVTDFTDTITVKVFAKNEQVPELSGVIKKGNFLKIKGNATFDKYDQEISIANVWGIRKGSDTRQVRNDLALHKRVELHCHTKMSDMDGVSYVSDIIKQAIRWGHKAIAITDHGVVQAFTDAFHTMSDLKGSYAKKGEKLDFKIIYGVEAYLVDDTKQIVTNPRGQSFNDTYVVFDLETTGFSAEVDRIIEIGAVKVCNGEIVDRFSTFVNPEIPIPFRIETLTHINDQMVMNAPKIEEILPKFLEFCEDAVMVAHNAEFDTSFIINKAEKIGINVDTTIIDTVLLAQFLMPNLHNYKLDTLTKHLNVVLESHHRAVDDAAATADIFVKMIKMLYDRDIPDVDKLNEEGKMDENAIKKLHQYHCIILASNEMGRINLYRLVSASHLQYFNRFPKIPKSLVNQYREGLIIGSACEAGELFRSLVNGRSEAEIARIVNFYDYLEIQPIGNNRFMIEKEDCYVQNEEDLRNLNRKIVELGDKFGKPVVATCDVHFLNPEDEVYRRIIMAGKGFDDADNQAPLYLHTTEEMLHECDYLGSDKAYEVVVTNTNKIMDMCEEIEPVRPDKCPPFIENSDQMLRTICENRAHEIYGPELPQIVTERLERELNSIISNGYSVMYIIAQKLVWKSNDDGYLVGSRGSVGSSLAATMAGITEVNPLSPHYLCPKCYYNDFYSDEVKAFAGGAGCDMPDKICPKCGAKLNKMGFDIPFETFLGFKGNKEPDIDLNFSGDYQSNAHKYTEVIFGAGQTFRAGTVGTLADKTAFGYVKNYYEEHGQGKRKCEIDRIVQGCTGIRRSTGQHPGGIIVLPLGEEINSFTPVQHPANDMTTDIVTTHFDYHSIDHNLLKLDILGHDDPTMIKTLEEYISSPAMDNEYNETDNRFDATKIPLDDPGVISLFHDTSALGIKPDDIGGCPVGCLGIPEFGTDFVIQMVVDTKPNTISDLIRISGLSHGTDVWLNNAQELIRSGKATISTAICTRDDIMTYLINKGMDSEESFTIMERVRKGTVAKGKCKEWPEFKKDMAEHNVPDWYVWSCEQIKYMFPKAHAAAYVMMAYRIAYCKINYPLAYYGAYFGIRADAFSYEIMCQGKEKLQCYIDDYNRRSATLSKKEQDTMKDMKIVQEMYARGFEFEPLDIYKAQATKFLIVNGKLMPPLSSIDGMGEKAAEAVAEASKDGTYLSLDDFRQRTKASKTVIDTMVELGILADLPASNQLSLFDF